MGLAYESGKGIKQSNELALKNLRKASEAGSKEAPYRLARLLVTIGGKNYQKEALSILEAQTKVDTGEAARLLGQGNIEGWFGETKDFDKIRAWWEKAESQGDIPAISGLARLFDGQFGFPEKRDSDAALEQYLKVAKQGNGPAMLIAGSRFLESDEKKARALLAAAIKKEQFGAYFILGNFAEGVTKDDSIAYTEYLKGAEKGHSDCMLKVASFLLAGRGEQEKNPNEALAWFKKAANAGQVLGHVQAARILMQGDGLNIVEAYNHILISAESGLVDMQNELGLLYLSGSLGIRDSTAAASWFRRSAAGKFPAGAYNLAVLLEQGIGVPQNFDRAGQLYTLAANTGHVQSTTALGRFHAEGRGTKQDLPRAWALFSLALERGDKEAKSFIEQVAANLDEDGMKKANKILAEYQKASMAPESKARE